MFDPSINKVTTHHFQLQTPRDSFACVSKGKHLVIVAKDEIEVYFDWVY